MKQEESDFSVLHRDKSRIQTLGEVFTPKIYVDQMIDLISSSDLSDETIVFFEPTCGHGNIVEALLERRLSAIYKKYKKANNLKPAFHASANAINTLWAIDIDSKNVQQCRVRVLRTVIGFLKQIEHLSIEQLIHENFEFIVHLLCAIIWQIHQNETLSALSNTYNLEIAKTKAAYRWMRSHPHHPVDFSCTWVNHFHSCKNKKKDLLHTWVRKSLGQIIRFTGIDDRALEEILLLDKNGKQQKQLLEDAHYYFRRR